MGSALGNMYLGALFLKKALEWCMTSPSHAHPQPQLEKDLLILQPWVGERASKVTKTRFGNTDLEWQLGIQSYMANLFLRENVL